MSSFTSRLEVSPMPDGRHWQVLKEFTFHIGSKESFDIITIPVDFITDFASFPRLIWRCLMWWLPGWAKYSKPSPIHDLLYQYGGYWDTDRSVWVNVTRKRADDVFLEAMHVAWRKHRSGKAIAWMEYWGVRAFGWLAWKKERGE